MPQRYELTIADQRQIGGLYWLTLHAPDLVRAIRPGQYLLVRCSAPEGFDPVLRRPLFVAAVEEALGQIGLLYAPSDRGLSWLSRGRIGDLIDVTGPFGQPIVLDRRTRTLLLLGEGTGMAALLLLARQAGARGCSVTLLVGADQADLLPPPFLLPGDVEYQSTFGAVTDLLLPEVAPEPAGKKRGKSPPVVAEQRSSPLIRWADQIVAALPEQRLPALRDAVRATKYQWNRGFASVLLEGPLPCGVGACGICAIQTRRGWRQRCVDGPALDLRDLAELSG